MNEKTELSDEQIDKVLGAAYRKLVLETGYSGGMGSETWDRAAARAIEAALAASPSSKSTKEAERLTALLERLRERCAETAEGISSDYPESARDTAEAIRAIELDVAVRQYLASSSIKEDGERAEPVLVLAELVACIDAGRTQIVGVTDREKLLEIGRKHEARENDVMRRARALIAGLSSPPSPLGDTPDQQEQKR